LLVATVLLAVLASVVSRHNAELADKNSELDAARAQEQSERAKAEANARLAKQSIDEYFTRVSENRLLKVPGLQPLRKELLNSALSYYRRFLRERGDDPALQEELERIHVRYASTVELIGSNDEAFAALEAAREFLEKRAAGDPSPATLKRLASIHNLTGVRAN